MLILLFAFFFCIFLGRIKNGPLFFLVAFPGVVLHELSHFITAILLRGRPDAINLVPKRNSDGSWVLGSVTFCPSWWNAGFVALAPLYVLPAVGWVIYSNMQGGTLPESAIGGYLLACIAWGARPSGADWKIAIKRPLGTLVLIPLLVWAGQILVVSAIAQYNVG